MNPFVEISLLLVVVSMVSLLMRKLKQPLIVGYILTGIVAGPYGLKLIKSVEPIELFSQIGIATLLFIVGISMSPKVIKEVGKVSLITGLGQVMITSLVGFGIARFLGIATVAAMYIAIALTFSSTIIVLKLLSDRGDLEKLYGKVTIGFLLVQDIIATLILLFVSTGSQSAGSPLNTVLLVLGKAILLFGVLWVVSQKILPKILAFSANSSELLFIFTLAWGLGIGSLFHLVGFSLEIGTLIAGVALSVSPFAKEMTARMKPLRDFFIILFFVLLGSHMILDSIPRIIGPALLLSIFVLIGNPVIMILIMNALGYRRRTSFMAGLTVAQISEFSLILATLGFNLGHLSKDNLSLITLVGLVTIMGSSYLIQYADPIYKKVNKLLKLLELKSKKTEKDPSIEKYDAYLFGYGRVGNDYIDSFNKMNLSYAVVDHDPSSIEKLIGGNHPNHFGDMEDLEFLEELPLSSAKIIVTTIADFSANILLVRHVKRLNPNCLIIAISHKTDEAQQLYIEGASYVIMPHYLGARYGVSLMRKIGQDKDLLMSEREKHQKFLSSRST